MTERENKVWESTGQLWQTLAIYETVSGYVGVLSNSQSFMADREITFPGDLTFDEIVETMKREDTDFYDQLTLYADEG